MWPEALTLAQAAPADGGAVDAAKSLLTQGVLGVITFLALFGLVYMFRLLTSERKAHTDQLERITNEHALRLEKLNTEKQAALDAWEQRYTSKAETWMSKWAENAQAQTALADALQKRRKE